MRKKKAKTNHTSKLKGEETDGSLIRKIRAGDTKSKLLLIDKYSSYASSIAHKYHSYFRNIEHDELLAEANRGLLEAINRYNPAKLAKFSTYAWFWIIKNIHQYINSTVSFIGLPQRILSDIKKILHILNNEIKEGKEPSFEMVSKKLNLDTAMIREIISAKRDISNPLSLDKYLDENNEDTTLGDLIESKKDLPLDKILGNSEFKKAIPELMKCLAPDEIEVIKWRFGLYDRKTHTLKEISRKLKISPSKVKDIEIVALIKLKKALSQADTREFEEN